MTVIDQLWPHAALIAVAFAAATLLPVSSEVALVAAIKAGLASPAALVLSATLGNVAGSTFNWWLGRHVRRFEGRRWFPFAPATIARASEQFARFGLWSLLLAWLPVIGDPLTFIAGMLRVRLSAFLALVAIGKAARYVAVVATVGT